MLELQITPATIVLLAVILALVVFAVRRMTRKGLCDCKDCSSAESGNCQSCSATDKMLADMESASKKAS